MDVEPGLACPIPPGSAPGRRSIARARLKRTREARRVPRVERLLADKAPSLPRAAWLPLQRTPPAMTTQQAQPQQVSALSALLRTHGAGAGGGTPTPSRPGSAQGTPVTSPVVGHAAVGQAQGFASGSGSGSGEPKGSLEGEGKVGARPING